MKVFDPLGVEVKEGDFVVQALESCFTLYKIIGFNTKADLYKVITYNLNGNFSKRTTTQIRMGNTIKLVDLSSQEELIEQFNILEDLYIRKESAISETFAKSFHWRWNTLRHKIEE